MTSSDEISTLFEGFMAAWNDGDVAGVAARFTDDGRLISPFGHDARGIDAVRGLYQQFLGDGPLKGSQSTLTVEDVRMLGDGAAVADCHQVIDGSALGELDLHLVAIVVAGEDGWRIADGRPYAFMQLPDAAA